MTDNNMRIWDRVFHTDPKHTKTVSFGRKFTSIDPMYQIRTATEMFGPIGTGWTYNAEYEFHENLICCYLTIQYQADDGQGTCKYGPVMGIEEWRIEKAGKPIRIDTDAGKKALTDALTKALSHLGFNADVFLGLFDDQKYVARMNAEAAAKDSIDKTKEDVEWGKEMSKTISTLTTQAEINEIKTQIKAQAQSRDKGVIQSLVSTVTQAETNLTEKE